MNQNDRLFVDAVVNENKEEVRRLLPLIDDINEIYIRDMPALHFCCEHDMLDTVKICFELSKESIDVDKRYDKSRNLTLLHYACRCKRSTEWVSFLVETAGYDVEAGDRIYKTPLFYACKGSSLSVVRYLVEEAGVNVDRKNYNGFSPLCAALSRSGEGEEVVVYMAERSIIDSMAMKVAWTYGGLYIQVLINNYANRRLKLNESYVSSYPLHSALRAPFPSISPFVYMIKDMYSDAASVMDPNGQLPLHVAIGPNASVKAKFAIQLLLCEPRSAAVRDSITGFYPFQKAALSCDYIFSIFDYYNDDAKDELELVFRLLRSNPGQVLATRRSVVEVDVATEAVSERRVRQKTVHLPHSRQTPSIPSHE